MFGPDILVAPVLYQGMQKRTVYLPQGSNWVDANTAKVHEGGSIIECEAPLDVIPAFIKEGKDIKIFE
jgi:alpha-D-xyloside xylohydrolase